MVRPSNINNCRIHNKINHNSSNYIQNSKVSQLVKMFKNFNKIKMNNKYKISKQVMFSKIGDNQIQ